MAQKSNKRKVSHWNTPPLCPDCQQPGKPRAKKYPDWKPDQFVFTCNCEFMKL